jgi:hypothetical protein
MKVTIETLRALKGCDYQLALFQTIYPAGVEAEENNPAAWQAALDHASRAGLNVGWWLRKTRLSGIARIWYPDGALKLEEHYQAGKLQDAGEVAARRCWYPEGTLEHEEHYAAGERQDAGRVAVKNARNN